MNGKKARTIRKLWGIKHVRLVPFEDRPYLHLIRREKRPQAA